MLKDTITYNKVSIRYWCSYFITRENPVIRIERGKTSLVCPVPQQNKSKDRKN